MPQGLGRNLYPTLSVLENVDFFGRLFGQPREERERADRRAARAAPAWPVPRTAPAGKLSGGMKQKLGLCCALIHDPDLLILDEPTTGVDPLSRRQFWELIDRIRAAPARHERARLHRLHGGGASASTGWWRWTPARSSPRARPAELMARTGTRDLEAAFIAAAAGGEAARPPRPRDPAAPDHRAASPPSRRAALTKRFGAFTAVDHVSFTIERGEIFGFLGSNGCGKTTTMKMLTGLLPATEGAARLFGHPVDAARPGDPHAASATCRRPSRSTAS